MAKGERTSGGSGYSWVTPGANGMENMLVTGQRPLINIGGRQGYGGPGNYGGPQGALPFGGRGGRRAVPPTQTEPDAQPEEETKREGILGDYDKVVDAVYDSLPEFAQDALDIMGTDINDLLGTDPDTAIGMLLEVVSSGLVGGAPAALTALAKNEFAQNAVTDLLKNVTGGFNMDDWGVSGGQQGLADIMSGNPSEANVSAGQSYREEVAASGGSRWRTTYNDNTNISGNTFQNPPGSAGLLGGPGGNPQPAARTTGSTPERKDSTVTLKNSQRRPTAAPPSARPDYGTHDFNSGMDSGLLWNEYNETGETMRPSILPADNSGQPSFDDYNTRYNDPSYGGQPTPNTPPPSQPGGLLDSQWGDGTATQEDKNAFWGVAAQQNPDAFNQEQKQGIWANLAFQQNPDAFSQQQKKDLWYSNAMRQQGQQAQQGAQPNAPQDLGGMTTGGGSGGYLGVGGSHSLAAPTWNQATGKYEGGGPVRMDGGAVTAADRAGILAEAQRGRDAFEASGGAQLQRERIARYKAAQQGSLLGQAQQSGGLI